jgi:hypothetical protein
MKIRSVKRKLLLRTCALLLAAVLTVTPYSKAEAALWPGVDPIIMSVLDTVRTMIVSALTGAVKQMGAQLINKSISSIMAGGSGGPQFITNWENYIVRDGAQKTNNYINDYLTQATQGRGSSSGYVPATGFEGIGQGAFNMGVGAYTNYSGRLVEQAKAAILSEGTPQVTLNVAPDKMLSNGTFKNISQLGSGVNTVWGMTADGEQVKLQSLEDERDIAMAKAIAGQGFIGKEKNGQTVTPGSVAKEALTNAQNLPNLIIASSSTMIEAMIGMVVRTVVTKALNEGIGSIQSQIQKQTTGVTINAQNAINQQVQAAGPGALFKR